VGYVDVQGLTTEKQLNLANPDLTPWSLCMSSRHILKFMAVACGGSFTQYGEATRFCMQVFSRFISLTAAQMRRPISKLYASNGAVWAREVLFGGLVDSGFH
jgi:hypothetical protein